MADRQEMGTGRGREVSLEAEVARSADRPPCEAGENLLTAFQMKTLRLRGVK